MTPRDAALRVYTASRHELLQQAETHRDEGHSLAWRILMHDAFIVSTAMRAERTDPEPFDRDYVPCEPDCHVCITFIDQREKTHGQ